MLSLLQRIPLYISYFFSKVDAHSLQGPFAFGFYQIIKKKRDTDFPKIIARRKELELSNDEIEYSTFGQISKLSARSRKKIADIAKTGISSEKKSELLYRLVSTFGCKAALELGTSLGITTCYLAEAVGDGVVTTLEGHPELANIARATFQKLNYSQIHLWEGDIDETLPSAVKSVEKLDFVFVDANHKSGALIRYFHTFFPKLHERSIVIIDDIRWSPDMYRGWQKIRGWEGVTYSFDLGSMGVLFFTKSGAGTRQHFVLDF